MNTDPRPGDSRPDPDALRGKLREGVEQVRSDRPPETVQNRALTKAQAIKGPTFHPGGNRRSALVALGFAAALFAGVALCYTILYPEGDRDRAAAPSLQADRGEPEKIPMNARLNARQSTTPWTPATPTATTHSRPTTSDTRDVAPTEDPAKPHEEAEKRLLPDTERANERPTPNVAKGKKSPTAGDEKRRGTDNGKGDKGDDKAQDSAEREAALAQARFRYQQLQRTKKLAEKHSIEERMVDEAQAQYQEALRKAGGGKDQVGDNKDNRADTKPAAPAVEFPPRARPDDASKDQEEARRKLAGQKTKPEKPAPQVWKRDGRQPTFARVYIGGGNSLELVSMQVTVTVEGPRARTLVDHVFRNPHGRQLEGTFEYPLPSGASPSYFAMFLGQSRDTVPARFARRGQAPALSDDARARLAPEQLVKHVSRDDWGTLQEARVVAKAKALETYEDTVRGKIDPALLEYAGGNTFRGRVFPIPARGYNRVLIAYEELLPVSGDRAAYRFALPDCPLAELDLTLQANPRDCANPSFQPDKADKKAGKHLLSYHRAWKDKGPGGDALFTFTLPRPEVQALSGQQGENGPQYLYARLRPRLDVEKAAPFADTAVFLLDASLSERPDRFAVSVKLLRKILEGDPGLKRFNVLTFNVAAAWLDPRGWLDNTVAGRDRALKLLDGLVLEGATDFSAALDKVIKPGLPLKASSPLDVFVLSDGHITWGESDVAPLVARFERTCPFRTRFHCYRTGLGAENLELFEALTRRGGAVFNCFNEADLTAAARAHRQQCWQMDGLTVVGGDAQDVLIAGRKAALYPGGELVVAARLKGTGRVTLKVEGFFLGKRTTRQYAIDVNGDSELAPRGWAEIAVASLLALNDPHLDELVTAYCQQFGIGSRVASFLVLENDADFKRLNLQDERGKAVPGDLGVFLAKAWEQVGALLSPRAALTRFLARVNPRIRALDGGDSNNVVRLLALLKDGDCELPRAALEGPLTRREDVPAAFEKDLMQRRREVGLYIKESRRRLKAGDTAGAVRVLSSVVEEHPGRGDALRLVGYRLLDLHQAEQAARLFSQVQKDRPFEPHSWRDLARSLEETGKVGLAAVQYEVVLAGTWHNRFGEALKLVAREEYARMLREALSRKTVAGPLADYLAGRLNELSSGQGRSDLRVTISWNTDATDVDLWVIEPDGTKCFYSHNRTRNGGELTQDQTQGYGPERYQIKDAPKGTFRILVHYYRPNANLLAGETHVNVVITRYAGTAQEVTERHTVILKKHDEAVEVTSIEF